MIIAGKIEIWGEEMSRKYWYFKRARVRQITVKFYRSPLREDTLLLKASDLLISRSFTEKYQNLLYPEAVVIMCSVLLTVPPRALLVTL